VLFSYLSKHPVPFTFYEHYNCTVPFFCHYLLKFNRIFNLCFYKDFNIINNEDYWNNLLELNNKNINIFFNFINYENYNVYYPNNFFNLNKYFKLLFYEYYKCDIYSIIKI
jgi:hypothetical protein